MQSHVYIMSQSQWQYRKVQIRFVFEVWRILNRKEKQTKQKKSNVKMQNFSTAYRRRHTKECLKKTIHTASKKIHILKGI